MARLGNLGSVSLLKPELFDWFLKEVYDLRHPRLGDCATWPETLDSLRGKLKKDFNGGFYRLWIPRNK